MPLLNYARVGDAILNIVEVEKLITRDVSQILNIQINADAAQPFMRYESPVYPKWLNGISDDKPQEAGIYEINDVIAVNIELQLGKRTEGSDGALEQQLYTWIPYTTAMFRTRPLLTTDARPQKPLNLIASDIRLSKALMPGDIIAAQFVIDLGFFTTNPEKDY